MSISRVLVLVLATIAPTISNAQMNQLLGVIHSVQNAVTPTSQGQPQQDTAQQAQQQRIDYQTQHPVCNANCPLDPADQAKYDAQQRRDQQEGQQQLQAARNVLAICPDLANAKFNSAERIIRCRNKGLTEEQQMTVVGGLPPLAQAYAASMVQDVYEDNVTDPSRGKAISDYYNACLQRGTPCTRPKW